LGEEKTSEGRSKAFWEGEEYIPLEELHLFKTLSCPAFSKFMLLSTFSALITFLGGGGGRIIVRKFGTSDKKRGSPLGVVCSVCLNELVVGFALPSISEVGTAPLIMGTLEDILQLAEEVGGGRRIVVVFEPTKSSVDVDRTLPTVVFKGFAKLLENLLESTSYSSITLLLIM
jgi:hypothetical protein